ncbi:unnamed protein product, partial [Ectocarpus sp. 13 AM-2016]
MSFELTEQQLLEEQQTLENPNFAGELPTSDDVPPAESQLAPPPVAEPRDPPSGGHVENKGFAPPNVHCTATTPPPSPTPSATPAPSPSVTSSATPSAGAPSIAPSASTNMSSTRSRIQRVVDNHPDLLAEGSISELPPHIMTLMHRLFDTARQNQGRTQLLRSAPSSGGDPSTTPRSTPRNDNNRGGGNSSRSAPRERSRCSHPSCKKPLGHTTDTCFQRKREKVQATKNHRENTRPVAKRSCAEDRIPRKDQNNDDSDA